MWDWSSSPIKYPFLITEQGPSGISGQIGATVSWTSRRGKCVLVSGFFFHLGNTCSKQKTSYGLCKHCLTSLPSELDHLRSSKMMLESLMPEQPSAMSYHLQYYRAMLTRSFFSGFCRAKWWVLPIQRGFGISKILLIQEIDMCWYIIVLYRTSSRYPSILISLWQHSDH